MNEELKIIIRAVTDEARKNIAAVREELEGVQDTSEESGKAASTAMSGLAKGALAAVAAVAALTAALVSLGRAAQDVKKGFDKLNTTFLNAGSTTAKASETYQELFRFLGDHDKAIETAQSLALITNEEEKLSQWSTILQGAFAEMGDKLPIEGLAEAANETINTGVVTGVLADALNWAKVSEDGFNESLAQTNSLEEREVLVRNTLNGLYGNSAKLYEMNNQATLKYNESQARLNLTLSQASGYTTPLLTSLNNLSSTLLTFLAPALQTVAIYLTAFIQLIAEAIQWVGGFFGMFSSGGDTATADVKGYQNAMTAYQNSLRKAFGSTNSALEENLDKINAVKKATMGFDELNIVSTSTATSGAATGGGGIGGGSLPVAPNPADYGIGMDFSTVSKDIDEAKSKLEGILALVGAIAAGFVVWKTAGAVSFLVTALSTMKSNMGTFSAALKGLPEYSKAYYNTMKGSDKAWDTLIGKVKTFAGMALAIAGVMLTIKGYSDAWVNGIDWQNFAEILGGVALAVGGIYLAFGPLAAQVTLIIGGIAALVIGIKDLVTNGYSMQAVLMVLAGALAVGIGLVWSLNAALLANPITWIVVAIAALVAAFVILWNECEGFRNFWIGLWEGIKSVFTAVWDAIVGFFTVTIPNVFNGFINFVKENWQALLLLIVNPFAGAFKLLYDNCDGFREFIDTWIGKIKDFFKNMWEGIKNIFKGVGTFFKDTFSKAWEGVLKVFSAGGKVFKGIKEGILSVFKTVVNGLITGINKVVKVPFEGLNKILNTIHGIEIVGVKPFNWLTWRAPVPQIPKLAKGGIATSATLGIFGEAGREAILPLENNTEWMNELADKIAERNGGSGKPIYLVVDKKVLGQVSADGINDITRLSGRVPLVLV